MKVLYVMYNECFEWDAEKNRSNLRKHAGVDFEAAARVFADPHLMLRTDRVVDVGTQSDRCERQCCWWCMYIERRNQMAKKLSPSSLPGKQIPLSAASISNT